MILTLRAVALNDQPLTRPITARFDAAGGTIGRADHSTLALPDPERFISRKQAEVVFTGGQYLLRNVGSANPITLAGRLLTGGDAAALGDGDEIRIGGYLLKAEFNTELQAATATTAPGVLLRTQAPAVAVAAAASGPRGPRADDMTTPPGVLFAPGTVPSMPVAAFAPPALPPSPAPATPTVPPGNPFADLLGGGDDLLGGAAPAPAAPHDPFADLLAPAPPAAPAAAWSQPLPQAPSGPSLDDLMPAPAGVAAGSPAFAAPAAPAAPAALLPDDFDPFAPPSPAPAPAASPYGSPLAAAFPTPAATDTAAIDPLLAVAPVAAPASIDQQFGLGAAGADPLAAFELGGPSPAAGGVPAVDPLALFEADAGVGGGPRSAPHLASPLAPPAAPAFGAAVPDHLSGVFASFEPPPVPGATPAAAPAAPIAPPWPAGGDDWQTAWAAFCQGAGVQLPTPANAHEAALRLRQAGQVLRAAVDGTRELMAVRASTKYELRAAVTQIQARNNNPLKFAPDTGTGVSQLMQPASRGFLEGPAAMDDAMRDLIGHSIGSVAGMRAALEGLLDRFDPATLEQKLGAGSMLDTLVPLNRKARLWELYLQRFRGLREEAQENFHALFGEAFVAAYEQQVERLRRGSAPPPPPAGKA